MLVVLLIALMAIAAVPCFAQPPYVLDHIKLSSGKGPLNSGLQLTIDMIEVQIDQKTGRVVLDESKRPVKGDKEITLIFDADQGYGLYRFAKPGPFELLATGGVFRQTPWAGPMIKVNYAPWLSTTHWVGWSAGQVEHPYWGTRFLTSWQELTADFSHWTMYVAALNYAYGQRQDIFGVQAKINLSPKFQLRVGYDRDTSDARWCTTPRRDMFTVAVKYMPLG